MFVLIQTTRYGVNVFDKTFAGEFSCSNSSMHSFRMLPFRLRLVRAFVTELFNVLI